MRPLQRLQEEDQVENKEQMQERRKVRNKAEIGTDELMIK